MPPPTAPMAGSGSMPEMMALSGYSGLFLAAMGAATLLPMQSEAVLVGLLLTG